MHILFMNKTLNPKYHKPKANIKAKLSYNYGLILEKVVWHTALCSVSSKSLSNGSAILRGNPYRDLQTQQQACK